MERDARTDEESGQQYIPTMWSNDLHTWMKEWKRRTRFQRELVSTLQGETREGSARTCSPS
jgi:hypothetical protein